MSLNNSVILPVVVCLGLVAQTAQSAKKEYGPLPSWEGVCGPASLAIVAKLAGVETSLSQIRAWVPLDEKKHSSLASLRLAATKYLGCYTEHLSLRSEALERLNVPAIAHRKPDHFVAIIGLGEGNGVLVADPPKGFAPVAVDYFGTDRVDILAVSNRPLRVASRQRAGYSVLIAIVILVVGYISWSWMRAQKVER